MSNTSQRLMIVATLICAGFGPALASPKHPPMNPPLPPSRPAFPDDEAFLRSAAVTAPEAAQPQAQAEQTPVARTDDVREVAERRVAEPPVPTASLAARAYLEQEQAPGFLIAEQAGLAELTRKYARKHGVPLTLLHRIIMRESRYHPHLVHRTYYGLMQITPATARSMGYHGAPSGLLDPETNLAFASPYLANAWILADGDEDRAVRLYASGYYFTAKNKGMLGLMRNADSPPVKPEAVAAAPAAPPPRQPNLLESIFGGPAQ